ncbi:MAG: O-methyltransferase, partial [Candidatus Promineifilaceae bacterium]
MAKPSFREFDYRLRPAKCVERKMLCEAFRRLSFFAPVENYRYIGFGVTAFTDFILIHKALAITDMISIEKRAHYEARFEFNRPFQCIQMEYGSSNDVLPELTWDKRVIVWLDYENHLTDSELRDVAYIVMNAASGSMLVVSLYVGNYNLSQTRNREFGLQEARLQKLKEDVGSEKVPGDIQGK